MSQMRITARVIQEVVSDVVGGDAVPVVQHLRKNDDVPEVELAETLEVEVNDLRNILYRLFEHNLVSFVRQKDQQRGWYDYFWSFRKQQVQHLAGKVFQNRLERLQSRLEREKNQVYFACDDRCMRMDFDSSFAFSFRCPDCGELMEHQDNNGVVKEIKSEIAAVEQRIP